MTEAVQQFSNAKNLYQRAAHTMLCTALWRTSLKVLRKLYGITFGTMSGRLMTRSILTFTKCSKTSALKCPFSFTGPLAPAVLRPWASNTFAYSVLPAEAALAGLCWEVAACSPQIRDIQ